MPRKRQIFRPEALERYTRSRERSVLPRLVRPDVTRAAWGLLLLLALGAAAAARTSLPEFVAAPGVVVPEVQGAPALVLFVPPGDAAHVRPGAPVRDVGGSGATWTVRRVEPAALTPAAGAARLGSIQLPDAARRAPAVHVWAAPAAGSSAAMAPGAVVDARVRTGSRPLIGRLRGRGGP